MNMELLSIRGAFRRRLSVNFRAINFRAINYQALDFPALNFPALTFLALACLGLTACGFALRGSDGLSANIDTLALDAEQPNDEFVRLLRRSLDVANVTVQQAVASTSLPVLSVGNERVSSRPISINPRARAAQYEVRLSVDIALLQDEAILLAPQTLLVERTYFEDIANITGNRDEVEIITAEMRRDLVNQLLRRLEGQFETGAVSQ